MGSEQQLFPLDDGSALLLTVARYASPSGKIFMTDGVTPSIDTLIGLEEGEGYTEPEGAPDDDDDEEDDK